MRRLIDAEDTKLMLSELLEVANKEKFSAEDAINHAYEWIDRLPTTTEAEIRAKAISDIFEIMDNAVAHSSDHDERSMAYWVGFLKSEIEWRTEQLKEE